MKRILMASGVATAIAFFWKMSLVIQSTESKVITKTSSGYWFVQVTAQVANLLVFLLDHSTLT
jgi:hypothetical protein